MMTVTQKDRAKQTSNRKGRMMTKHLTFECFDANPAESDAAWGVGKLTPAPACTSRQEIEEWATRWAIESGEYSDGDRIWYTIESEDGSSETHSFAVDNGQL
jgi:hypothetical protein